MHKTDKIEFCQRIEGAIGIVRSANEELIRLSQRLGREVPKIHMLNLTSTTVRKWLDDYKETKVSVENADKELMKALLGKKPEMKDRKGDHSSRGFITKYPQFFPIKDKNRKGDDLSSGYATLVREYMDQKIRYEAKVETIEDILDGIVEEMNEDALIKPFIKKEKEARSEPSKECDLDWLMFQ